MTNYSSLRVTDLKDLLAKRKLPTNGNKAELISRLEAADREAAAPTAPAVSAAPPAADAKAHLPSAEEYEINWDEDDTTSAGGPKSTKAALLKPELSEVKKVVASASSGANPAEHPRTVGASSEKKTDEKSGQAITNTAADGKKPFIFKRLAEQFSDLPSVKKPDTKKSGTTAKPEIAQKIQSAAAKDSNPGPASNPETESKPTASEQAFKANLPPTPLELELEKRKARAARFGADNVDPVAAESLKKLERAARFGAADPAGTGDTAVAVKGLDQALPEHKKGKRSGDHVGGGGRGGIQKRTRYGDRNHGGRRPDAGGDRRNGGPPAGGAQNKASAPAVKRILDDPIEREKAEKRKNRFGTTV
ncbi:hypothetical protein BDZ91DRAFT_716413 [Kalaharituber pfeilii]|nr:hypothetical protein BDZ91DRAFT_716413 [Kalaharituber pfeilii]